MKNHECNNLYNNIRKHRKIMIFLQKSSLFFIVFAVLVIFAFFIISGKSVVKLVGGAENENDALATKQRFMDNPRLQVEDGATFYNIRAKRGYYETEDKIVFEDADIDSSIGTLTANEVIVEDNFSNITVQENPEITIYPENIPENED